MKFTAQEEYGLRCALQVARKADEIVTIPEIASREGLSTAYVGKLMRLLLQGGIVTSTRGHQGGYRLAQVPSAISVAAVVKALGGGLFPESFCVDHRGVRRACVHNGDCAIRSVWVSLDSILHEALGRIALSDLLVPEGRAAELIPLRLETADHRPVSAGPGS